MTDRELLDRIKAGEELETRGWKRITCRRCEGFGKIGDPNSTQCFVIKCFCCDGKGYTWESPITK
jgi:hypothetical protein